MNKELQLLVITQQLWNEFVEAGFTHPDEANEVRHEIHGIQSIVATRIIVAITIINNLLFIEKFFMCFLFLGLTKC